MRPNYSATSISIATTLMLASSISLATSHSSTIPTNTVYGLSNAKYFKSHSNGDFFIQAGTFKSEKNAENHKAELIRKYHYPVLIKKQQQYYITYIGPIHSVAEVRAINTADKNIISAKQEVIQSPVEQRQPKQHSLIIGDKDGLIEPAKGSNHFEVIGALGIASLMAGDGYLGVTSSETDRLVQTNRNDWDAFTAQLGIGSIYYLNGAQQYAENTQWFPWIEPELNAYYLGGESIKGDVWRFSSPDFNDMTFNMPFKSYRLMFDTALTVVSKKQYSLYAIGGIGASWNRIGYSDADRDSAPCADQYLNLNSRTDSSFVWEAGAGLAYALNDRFSLSLEYLYVDLGSIKTPDTGFTGGITAPVLVPADIKLTSQAVLLGLHVAI
jgi:opacity protein-like surface antigen